MAVAKFGQELALPVVQYLRRDITFSQAGTTHTVGILPENAVILDVMVYVPTAFNAGTSSVVDVGHTDDPDGYIDNVSVATVGRKYDATTMNASTALTRTTERTVTAVVTLTGTAATAGSCTVLVTYATAKR